MFGCKSARVILCVVTLLIACAYSVCLADEQAGTYTLVAPDTSIYSEYYPNAKCAFKGTIVFENGAGADISEWQVTLDKQTPLFDCARQIGSVFVYERSGSGRSDPDLRISVDNPITAENTVSKLLYVLKLRGAKPPYLMVAHSYGGLFVQYFARKYPELVGGVLFVDPLVVNYVYPESIVKKADVVKFAEIARAHSTEYMYKKYNLLDAVTNKEMPADSLYLMLGYPVSTRQINQLPYLNPQIPIIILTSSLMNATPNWYAMQEKLAAQTLNSKLITADSSHWIMHDQPELVCSQLSNLLSIVANPVGFDPD